MYTDRQAVIPARRGGAEQRRSLRLDGFHVALRAGGEDKAPAPEFRAAADTGVCFVDDLQPQQYAQQKLWAALCPFATTTVCLPWPATSLGRYRAARTGACGAERAYRAIYSGRWGDRGRLRSQDASPQIYHPSAAGLHRHMQVPPARSRRGDAFNAIAAPSAALTGPIGLLLRRGV